MDAVAKAFDEKLAARPGSSCPANRFGFGLVLKPPCAGGGSRIADHMALLTPPPPPPPPSVEN